MPAASVRRVGQLMVASCAMTAAEKTANKVAPASACDGWCSATTRNRPARPANSPTVANTMNALSAAA
jgi:hypothetical protein